MSRGVGIFDPDESPDSYSVRLVRCDASCVEPFDVELDKSMFSATEIELEPGRYYLEYERDANADDLQPFTVHLDELSE